MNDYSEVSAAIDPLIRLAHESGCHICLLHHARKGEMNEDSYLGSTALSASVDVVLHLDMTGEDRRRTLSTVKQRYPDGDTLEPDDRCYGRGPRRGKRDEGGSGISRHGRRHAGSITAWTYATKRPAGRDERATRLRRVGQSYGLRMSARSSEKSKGRRFLSLA